MCVCQGFRNAIYPGVFEVALVQLQVSGAWCMGVVACILTADRCMAGGGYTADCGCVVKVPCPLFRGTRLKVAGSADYVACNVL